MRTAVFLPTIFLLSFSSIATAVVLENKHVAISIDAEHGGAIVKMVHKEAPSLPFIAERGAQVAGQGRLMVPFVIVGGKRLNLSDVVLESGASVGELLLTADLSRLAPGLQFERRFVLLDDATRLRVVDSLINSSAAALKVRFGAMSRVDGQPWNQTLRCWFGDDDNSRQMFTPAAQGTSATLRSKTGAPFWRVVGQYGTGFLYLPGLFTQRESRPQPLSLEPLNLEMRLPREDGYPAEFQWSGADELVIPPAERADLISAIIIDTGGRDAGIPGDLLQVRNVSIHGDAPAACRSGATADCFVTVTAASACHVRAVVSEQTSRQNWGKQAQPIPPRQVASFNLDLAPGLAQVRGFRFAPDHGGLSLLRFEVQNDTGKTLASTQREMVVDGEHADGDFAKIWQHYDSKLPEYHLRGSWEEIGKQMARLKAISSHKNQQHGAERLAIYEKRFPLYARLLHGAAEELKCPADQVAASEISRAPAIADACMGIVVNGPDGPLNLYSKERGNFSFKGMAYLKVVPDSGYRYHMYTLNPRFDVGYGVNSAGLSTSGTSINCDANTERVGQEEAARLRSTGKTPAPLAMQMLLATCADVDEAIRFIDDPESPMEFTGNLLMADLKGQTAVLESAGIRHQIFRGQPGKTMDTGNYSHVRPDGLFAIGNNWGWAANTMLRERLLGQFTTEHQGQISLPDARQFMATQSEPGGMCQHLTDNVGILYSTCSSITVLRTRDLYISNGPPDQVQYVRYRLGDE